jgi:hypothetical protein
MRRLCVSILSVAMSAFACAADAPAAPAKEAAKDAAAQPAKEAAAQPAKEGADPKVDTWLLDFKVMDIKPIVVERKSGEGRLDWYVVYAVTNKDAQAHPLDVVIAAESDKGVKYSDLCLPETEEAVERKVGENFFGSIEREKQFPAAERKKALEELRKLDGDARLEAFRKYQARQQVVINPKETKRCIATFGALDPEADFVKIYVRNLTGTVVVKEKESKKVLEEHVLVLEFRIPGDEFGKSQDRFEYTGRKWIQVEREVPSAAKK